MFVLEKKEQYKILTAHAKKYCKLSAFQRICESSRPRERGLSVIAADNKYH